MRRGESVFQMQRLGRALRAFKGGVGDTDDFKVFGKRLERRDMRGRRPMAVRVQTNKSYFNLAHIDLFGGGPHAYGKPVCGGPPTHPAGGTAMLDAHPSWT